MHNRGFTLFFSGPEYQPAPAFPPDGAQRSTPPTCDLERPCWWSARRCRTAAERAGVRVDGARFVPHLTLARANRSLDVTRLVRSRLDRARKQSKGGDALFLYLALSKSRSNLGLARHQLRKIENDLEV